MASGRLLQIDPQWRNQFAFQIQKRLNCVRMCERIRRFDLDGRQLFTSMGESSIAEMQVAGERIKFSFDSKL